MFTLTMTRGPRVYTFPPVYSINLRAFSLRERERERESNGLVPAPCCCCLSPSLKCVVLYSLTLLSLLSLLSLSLLSLSTFSLTHSLTFSCMFQNNVADSAAVSRRFGMGQTVSVGERSLVSTVNGLRVSHVGCVFERPEEVCPSDMASCKFCWSCVSTPQTMQLRDSNKLCREQGRCSGQSQAKHQRVDGVP